MARLFVRTAVIAGLAFAAGFTAARSPGAAGAQAPPAFAMKPAYVYDLKTLHPPPNRCFPTLSTVDLPVPVPGATPPPSVPTPPATVTYAVGTLAEHYHSTANEIQYVISGTGTEIFNGKRVPIKPGTLFVIPPNTTHSEMRVTRGPLELLVIKTPKQGPGDNHMTGPTPSPLPAGC